MHDEPAVPRLAGRCKHPLLFAAAFGVLILASAGVWAQAWKPEKNDYLASAEFLKFLRAEDAKLRSALTDLGLAK